MKFHFRKYKKKQGKSEERHPKLIVDEDDNKYGFMGLTSNKFKGKGHKNIPLKKNPNNKAIDKSQKSYLRRKIEYDKKKNFGARLKDYQLGSEDIVRVNDYVKKHKKKR